MLGPCCTMLTLMSTGTGGGGGVGDRGEGEGDEGTSKDTPPVSDSMLESNSLGASAGFPTSTLGSARGVPTQGSACSARGVPPLPLSAIEA